MIYCSKSISLVNEFISSFVGLCLHAYVKLLNLTSRNCDKIFDAWEVNVCEDRPHFIFTSFQSPSTGTGGMFIAFDNRLNILHCYQTVVSLLLRYLTWCEWSLRSKENLRLEHGKQCCTSFKLSAPWEAEATLHDWKVQISSCWTRDR